MMRKIGVMRSVALLCVAFAGCAHVDPAQEAQAVNSVLGCWELTTINFKNPYIPIPTRIRLEDGPSDADPMYNKLQRLTSVPAGLTEERGYWYINPGDHHIMMKLGDGARGVSIDVVPETKGNRMYGRVGEGSTVRVTRTSCPAEES